MAGTAACSTGAELPSAGKPRVRWRLYAPNGANNAAPASCEVMTSLRPSGNFAPPPHYLVRNVAAYLGVEHLIAQLKVLATGMNQWKALKPSGSGWIRIA